MITTCRTPEISAVTQPPFFLSFPADSIRTSSNICRPSGSELMPTWSLSCPVWRRLSPRRARRAPRSPRIHTPAPAPSHRVPTIHRQQGGFKRMRRFASRWVLAAAGAAATTAGASAQVTPAAGYTPPDDTPSFKVGSTIFADYTSGNRINDAFNVSRAYINVTGNLNHYLAFRVTPDITRETGSGSSLNGSLTFRLKYAYAQLNLDDWTTHGSWVRFGIHQTPYMDYTETIYRYRFQGTIFMERI